jgi:hypothetical protein
MLDQYSTCKSGMGELCSETIGSAATSIRCSFELAGLLMES